MKSAAQVGFEWLVTIERADGRIERERVRNLVPTEGLNHMMATEFKGGAQVTQWYIALFEGDYTPQPGLTAAAFPSTALECTAYDAISRPDFVTGSVSNGAVDNSSNKAEFIFNDNKTIYGGVITSSQAKGSVNGVLASAVKFGSPKLMNPGDKLTVVAANSLTSAA
ncbi:hypothetical protein [Variovorax sp. RCC_210]|uniref:hypothetical protein n=1 Tax=Variovorax sp. RCC_210 TaxID=3239217 RepID=UPI003525FC3A